MSADIELWRTAKLFLEEHGARAATQAAGRLMAAVARGDATDAQTWGKIHDAVRELQRTDRRDGETLH
jgi:hypothetical protein